MLPVHPTGHWLEPFTCSPCCGLPCHSCDCTSGRTTLALRQLFSVSACGPLVHSSSSSQHIEIYGPRITVFWIFFAQSKAQCVFPRTEKKIMPFVCSVLQLYHFLIPCYYCCSSVWPNNPKSLLWFNSKLSETQG